MIYFLIFITIIYFVLIALLIIGYNKVETICIKNTTPKNTFSIVIPFRNEAHNLPNLLHSLAIINYPKNLFEIILVNDYSTDNFKSIITHFKMKYPSINLKLINNHIKSNSPKKDAITTAIALANYEWIVTTDADCIVPINWLLVFNQHILEKNPLFISAPVKFIEQDFFLFHFQNLNFISLMGSTIGGFGIKKPFMCNGANLCYNKVTFNQIGGFKGNTEMPSGDDVFILEKIHILFPHKTLYLKATDSIVQTNAENNLKSFFNQQIRWASKTTAYKSNFTKFIGFIIFLLNFMLILLLITSIIKPFIWKYLFVVFVLKFSIDFILIYKTSVFFKTRKSLKYFPIISLLHPFFVVFTGVFSLFKNHEWKGRVFKY
ncbi:glycosyltransferase [Lutibacter sp.]|uniref:glycosyltransferase family 2 protein n=1 Tax=Lutibacter sp. TaxID=1925666 RepID=UPI0025BD7E90|nr:glycosyltransferase [Lutibacter sp.]MCF6168523.1 glycosyltransferase [Lutibacter sp.]